MKTQMVDLTYLRTISNNNQEFIGEMIQSFLDHAPAYLQEIEKAFRQKDWSQLALSAHKLKPSATYMGIDDLLKVIVALEDHVKQPESNMQRMGQSIEKMKQLCQKAYPHLREKLSD